MPIDCITARICDYPLNLKLNLGFDVLFNCTTKLPVAIATPPNYLTILCGGKLKIKIKNYKKYGTKTKGTKGIKLIFGGT
jgi:hypothetical protein